MSSWANIANTLQHFKGLWLSKTKAEHINN